MKDYRLIKNCTAFRNFEKACKNNSISHCYIIANEEEDFAIEFAKLMFSAIFCKQKQTCFECEDCVRAGNLYNNNIEVFPKKDEKMDKDEIKEILDKCSLTANEQGRHIFFIQHFHTMQEKMQNKLLKTFEEPCDNVTFVLTCQNLQQILPTIQSRATIVTIDNFSKEEIANELLRMYPEKASNVQFASILAEGNFGKAEKILCDTSYQNILTFAFDVVNNYDSSKFLDFSNRFSKIKDKILPIFETLLICFRDLLMRKTNLPNLCVFKNYYTFDNLSNLTQSQLVDIIENIGVAKQQIKQNANKQMIFDLFLVSLDKNNYKDTTQ